MRTLFSMLTSALILLSFLTACNKKDAVVTGVTLNETSITLIEGEFFELIATVHPGNAANKNVSWQSTNEAVATVDGNGSVFAVSIGQATIIVITEDGEKTAVCAVNVAPMNVISVVLNRTTAELGGNDTMTLIATVLPEQATNKNVSWRSTNTSVANVNNGFVTTTMNGGTTLIIVTTEENEKSDTCRLTVIIPVEGVSLDRKVASIGLGDSLTLRANVLPATATNKAVTWRSTNTSVATVNDGVVKAIALGTTSIIVVTDENEKADTCLVTAVETVPNCNTNTPGWGTSLG
ncbi:MAG: Ig-like domain-containing protein, partial [Bacteroidales bacterium]|nr:Ig-like domain-containing protein [Bacteroidales bacterium]